MPASVGGPAAPDTGSEAFRSVPGALIRSRPMRLFAALLLACLVRLIGAQRTGTTTLAVHVNQEARLDPRRVALNFRVSADGASDVAIQTASVAAWVRALPGQQIRVIARLVSLNGPDGPMPVTQVGWAGSATRATAGGPGGHLFQRHFPAGRHPRPGAGVAAFGNPHLRSQLRAGRAAESLPRPVHGSCQPGAGHPLTNGQPFGVNPGESHSTTQIRPSIGSRATR